MNAKVCCDDFACDAFDGKRPDWIIWTRKLESAAHCLQIERAAPGNQQRVLVEKWASRGKLAYSAISGANWLRTSLCVCVTRGEKGNLSSATR